MEYKFKVGDIVKIVRVGGTYSLYREWAERYELSGFVRGKNPENGSVGKIVVIAPHASDRYDIFAVEMADGRQFIMSSSAIKLVASPEFKIGDTVKIISTGGMYTTYPAFAEKHDLTGYRYGASLKNLDGDTIGEIVAVGHHEDNIERIVYGIQMPDGSQFIFDNYSFKSLELFVDQNPMPELKSWMRVKTREGNFYIIYELDGGELVSVRLEGFNYVNEQMETRNKKFNIVEVYAAPYVADVLDPSKKGELLWSETKPETPQQKAVRELEESIAESQRKLAELKSTL